MKKIDYTRFGSDGSAPTELRREIVNKQWWKTKGEELAGSVTSILALLGQQDSARQLQYQISTKLYGNQQIMGLIGLSKLKGPTNNGAKDRVSYNLVQSCIDTITAKMAKNKPKPLFLTSGGDYKLQRKAKKLDKFVEGIFYENDAYKLGLDIFRDSGVYGDGVVHVYDHYGRVKFERVLAQELYVDAVEAFYGEPRQLHRVKNINRDVLCDLFPEKKALIMSANTQQDIIEGDVSDQITVAESWHLPSGPDCPDGLHCINIAEGNLFTEKWEKDFFPFAFLPWSKRMYGFWSQGAAEQLQNIQLEINKLLWVIQRSMHMAGTFKILMENGSKIVKEHFNNDIGTIVTYSTTPPQYITPPIVPVEIYNHLQTLKTLGFEQVGVSLLSAASQKPQGLDSGKALREFNDIESDRFQVIGQRYEQFYIQLGKLAIATAKEIYSSNNTYEVSVPGKKFIDTIDWKEIDLADDEYTMKIFPVSSLPNDPAGRLSTIQEYMQAGLISPRQGRRLLDFPDLEQIENLQNSEEDYLHKILEQIIDGDGTPASFTPPEPYDDLGLAQELALEYYSQGKQNDLEPEKLELIRMFIDQVNILKQKAMPPPPMMASPGAPGAVPQALPQAAPQSDMIPNVGGVAS